MGREPNRRVVAVAALALALSVAGTTAAVAQNPLCPLLCPPAAEQEGEPTPTEPTTDTTAPDITLLPPEVTEPIGDTTSTTIHDPVSDVPGETTETTGPGTTAPGDSPSTTLPEDLGEGTDGAGLAVPPAAQAVIDSIRRTAPNDNAALVEGVASLVAVGVPEDEAALAVYGAFPVHGPTQWVDDWYYPRWTGTTFRHHLGLDMMADFGTPVGSPADGIAQIGNNALGGLTVRVVEPDGTFWYLAHLSDVADGLTTGDAVTLGQVVGYVGNSGNAQGGAPHLHFAVHPGGGAPVPPKPIVDDWVTEGAERVVALLAQGGGAAPPPAALVAADLTRRLADGVVAGPAVASGPPRSELLWASAANPNGGAVAVADATAASLNEGVDWEQRAAQQRSLDLAWAQATDRAWVVLGPLVHPAFRPG